MFKVLLIIFRTLIYCKSIAGLPDEEYCISEIFKPSCSDGEIIIIIEAHFGRKQIGRCLQDDEGLTEVNLKNERYIGCFNDVKEIINEKCSGKSGCEIRVVELSSPKSCYNYLKSYLGVIYKCIKLIQGIRECTVNLIGNISQYLPLAMLASKSDCGTHFKPWIIEAMKGQQILASLEDFSSKENNKTIIKDSYYYSRNCEVKLGYIVNKPERESASICIKDNNRFDPFYYMSKSNMIEVVTLREEKVKIIALKLDATGCSDLIPPADAWLKRIENEATIGCYSTRLRWQLRCVGQRWIGVIGNCSYGNKHDVSYDSKDKIPRIKSNQTVTLITIGMCGVVVSCLIASTGLICIRKWNMISKTKRVELRMGHSTTYNNGTLKMNSDYNGKAFLKDNLQPFQNNDCQKYYELDQSFGNKNSM